MNFLIRSISMNHFVVKPALNSSNRRLNHQIGQIVRFFTNWWDLNSTNICLLLRDPLSIMSIPRSVLLKLKLIISPYLVQATKAQSNDKKTYKTFTWAMPPDPICWDVLAYKACCKVFIEHLKYIEFMCFRCGTGNRTD